MRRPGTLGVSPRGYTEPARRFDPWCAMTAHLSIPALRRARRGFTLLEGMMATGILLITVLAISSAITAGQQHAMEAQMKVSASMAADDIMGRVVHGGHDNLLVWHGFREDPGTMMTSTGHPFPEQFRRIGREVRVVNGAMTLSPLDDGTVSVPGWRIVVRVFDAAERDLIVLHHFVPGGGA